MPAQDDSAPRTGAHRAGDHRSDIRRHPASALLGRAEERINEALHETADRIQAAAERLGTFAGDRFSGTEGAVGRAGDLAHSLADSLERAADYVRTSDLHGLRTSLERRTRERPLQTLVAGIAAGWVVGKILR